MSASHPASSGADRLRELGWSISLVQYSCRFEDFAEGHALGEFDFTVDQDLELNDADQLLFDQFEESWAADGSLAARARNNDFQNFRLVFDRTFLDTVVKRMDENDEIFRRILDDAATRQTVLDHYAERLYGRLRAEHDQLGLTEAP